MSCPSRSRRVAPASTSKAMKGATLDLSDRGILASDRSAINESLVIFPVFPAASRQNTAALQSSLYFRIGGFERRMFPYDRRCIKMPDLIQEDDSCFGEVTRFRVCTLAVFAMAFIVTAAIVGLAWRRWRSAVFPRVSLPR